MTAITKSYFDSEEITVFLLFPSLYSFVNIFFRYSIFSFPQSKNMLWPLHNSMIKCIADSDLFKQTQHPFIKLLLWLYYPCSALKLLKKYSVVHYAKSIAFKMWINNPHTAFFFSKQEQHIQISLPGTLQIWIPTDLSIIIHYLFQTA